MFAYVGSNKKIPKKMMNNNPDSWITNSHVDISAKPSKVHYKEKLFLHPQIHPTHERETEKITNCIQIKLWFITETT